MGIPTNVVDAAAAIKDGVLGAIETIKIGDLVVSALTGLEGSDEWDIVQRPVEAGFLVTDAVVKLPYQRTLHIVLANPDFSVEAGITAALTGSVDQFTQTWRDKKSTLESMGGQVLSVATHERVYESALIQSIVPWYDVEENWDLYIASVRIVEYQVDTSDELLNDPLMGALQAIGVM